MLWIGHGYINTRYGCNFKIGENRKKNYNIILLSMAYALRCWVVSLEAIPPPPVDSGEMYHQLTKYIVDAPPRSYTGGRYT